MEDIIATLNEGEGADVVHKAMSALFDKLNNAQNQTGWNFGVSIPDSGAPGIHNFTVTATKQF